VQAELWTEAVFNKIRTSLKPNGVIITYSCKGIVKRALKSVGFEIKKLPGPKGKREILKAIKTEGNNQ
jgi:tRNA U34 5-methylaminomethyl-2-thiouridine-forming methyltransferase MnmC